MRIATDLKIVLSIGKDDKGEPLFYAYHQPVAREVFDANYRIISATHSALFSKGVIYAAQAAPLVASLRLLDEGKRDATERGDIDANGQVRDGGAGALLAEIKRLTTVLAPGSDGWQMLPVDAAIRAAHLDQDDWREVESALVFFTAGFWMARKADRETMAGGIAGVIAGQITSLSVSGFIASLPTLTRVAVTEPRAVSSVPS